MEQGGVRMGEETGAGRRADLDQEIGRQYQWQRYISYPPSWPQSSFLGPLGLVPVTGADL